MCPRTYLSALVVLFSFFGGLTPLSAQLGRRPGGMGINGLGPRLGENIQLALENRLRLDLTDQQVAELTGLEREVQASLAPLQTEIDDLRFRILEGEVNRVDGSAQLRNLLADFEEMAAPYRTHVTEILSAGQHSQLQSIMLAARPDPWAGSGYGLGGGFRRPIGTPAVGILDAPMAGATVFGPRGRRLARPWVSPRYGLGRGLGWSGRVPRGGARGWRR